MRLREEVEEKGLMELLQKIVQATENTFNDPAKENQQLFTIYKTLPVVLKSYTNTKCGVKIWENAKWCGNTSFLRNLHGLAASLG